jgi:FtsH-binding integral membrane protein
VPYQAKRRIRVDLCGGCDGLWLDAGELEQIGKVAEELRKRFSRKRLARLQERNRRREALSAVYGVKLPAAKAPVEKRVAFLTGTYAFFVVTLGLMALGAFIGGKIGAHDHWGLWFLAGWAIFIPARFVRKVPVPKFMVLFVLPFVQGVTASGVMGSFFGTAKGPIVLHVLLITTGVFLSLAGAIRATRKDLTGWSAFLLTVLLTLVFSGLVMLAFSIPLRDMAWTWLGVVAFCGYVVYDTSRILLKDEPDDSSAACLDLYLDVVNLFLDKLRIRKVLQR